MTFQLPTAYRRGILVVVLLALALTTTASVSPGPRTTVLGNLNTGGAGGGAPITATVDPVPPEATAPTISSPPTAAAPGESAPSAAPNTALPSPAASRTPSAQEVKALQHVGFWWDVFVLAFAETQGTKLTTAQLTMPPVVVVAKASCPQPASNQLGPKSHQSLTYCGGKLELVPDVFLTITEPGQLKVVASGFLYHALAKATPGQRTYPSGKMRNDAQVLGCLQASLSYALRRYQAIASPNEAWVVMKQTSTGGDIHNSYYATIDNGGMWS